MAVILPSVGNGSHLEFYAELSFSEFMGFVCVCWGEEGGGDRIELTPLNIPRLWAGLRLAAKNIEDS